MKRFITYLTGSILLAVLAATAHAVTIETVPVGNPGNAGEQSRLADYGDATYYGSVGYAYNIGKYEVTAGQYTEFLNAVAATDTHELYNMSMWSSVSGCKIQRSGSSGSYTYSVASDLADRPVNYVGFWDATRFANWLHNGQGGGDTEAGAYINIDNHITFARQAGALFFIPTEDEWYKSAYHKNDGVTGNYWDYPTRKDVPNTPGRDMSELTNPGNNANYSGTPYPIDSPYYTTLVGEFQSSASPYGTFDQGGNVWEWNETVIVGSSHGLRGGSFYVNSYPIDLTSSRRNISGYPTNENDRVGFRVASIPEPGAITLFLCGLASLFCWRRRK